MEFHWKMSVATRRGCRVAGRWYLLSVQETMRSVNYKKISTGWAWMGSHDWKKYGYYFANSKSTTRAKNAKKDGGE